MPRTKSKPVSAEQLAANRANAGRSTGPRSPEGKARSAQNARKHGFTASTFAVVRLEDVNEIDHLREDAVAVYQPVNSQELFAVERIALAQQSMLRAARLESGLFTTCLNETVDQRDRPMVLMAPEMLDGDMEITRAQNRNYCLAEGFHSIARKSNAIGLFLTLPGPVRTPVPSGGGGIRPPQSSAPRITKRTHFRAPTRTNRTHLPVFRNEPNEPRNPHFPIGPARAAFGTGHRPPATGIRSKSPAPRPWPRSEPPVSPPLCKNCNIVICRR
jgi:hypothetical protein